MRIIHAFALAVVLGGAAMLANPSPASATYVSPIGSGGTGGTSTGSTGGTSGTGGENTGITFCCRSNGANCCFVNIGCQTKPGMCGPYG